MPDNPHISIVSPVYRAEETVDKLVEEIERAVQTIGQSFEIILVEDGSPDNSWSKIEKNCQSNPKVKGIKLSRNFGQHYAITAGLRHAKGDWVVVMDCDLQDRPEEIPNLYEKASGGFDLVYARRSDRKDGFMKKLSSRIFYSLFSYLTDTFQDRTIANFGIYRRQVIEAILEMGDYIRYFPTMSQWVGFKKAYMEVDHGKRDHGSSSYTFGKLLDLALNNIIAFSDKPLRLTVKLGFFISLISGIIGLTYLIQYFIGGFDVEGWASLIISLWFLAGIIIFILGIVGIYIGKTFEKVKERPIFIIQEKLNID
ncbi:MAG: glycosyltransferase family 2 protein [Bacteroidota bacterium]